MCSTRLYSVLGVEFDELTGIPLDERLVSSLAHSGAGLKRSGSGYVTVQLYALKADIMHQITRGSASLQTPGIRPHPVASRPTTPAALL